VVLVSPSSAPLAPEGNLLMPEPSLSVGYPGGGGAVKNAIALVVAACALTLGCVPPRSSSSSSMDRINQLDAKIKSDNDSKSRAFISTAEAGKVPKDSKKQVDKWLAENLKDPGSRQVEFGKPTAHLACATVNAKNSYGGYTGKQPFVGWFSADGKLVGALTFSAKEVSDWSKQTSSTDIGHEYYWLLHECGFI
jgi:hypothetical protein